MVLPNASGGYISRDIKTATYDVSKYADLLDQLIEMYMDRGMHTFLISSALR